MYIAGDFSIQGFVPYWVFRKKMTRSRNRYRYLKSQLDLKKRFNQMLSMKGIPQSYMTNKQINEKKANASTCSL